MQSPTVDVRRTWHPFSALNISLDRWALGLQLGPLTIQLGARRHWYTSAPPNPVFVVGCPRSGTSLVGAIVASHPACRGLPETHFFTHGGFPEMRELVMDTAWPAQAVEYLDNLSCAGERILPAVGRTKASAREQLAAVVPSMGQVFDCLRHPGIESWKRLVDSTPQHLLVTNVIRRFFPTAPIIAVVRDPRDTAYSLQQVPWGDKSFSANLFTWTRYATEIERQLVLDQHFHCVKYEWVLRSPFKAANKLARIIGERFDYDMLHHGAAAEAMTLNAERPWKKNVGQKIDTSRGYAWKGRITAAERAAVHEQVSYRLMATFGYEL